jgi:hypothetical protein
MNRAMNSSGHRFAVHFARAFTAVLMVSGFCIAGGCSGGHSGPVAVPMIYQPTDMPEASMQLPTGSPKVYIEVTDTRPNATSDQIGQNTEESTPVPVRAAGGTPAQFVKDSLTQQLNRVGVATVATADGADRKIMVNLTVFQADEASTYHAQIMTLIKVQDASGKDLWEHAAAGDNTTFGKSLNPEDYQQVLSNAMVKLFSSVMADPSFAKALSK